MNLATVVFESKFILTFLEFVVLALKVLINPTLPCWKIQVPGISFYILFYLKQKQHNIQNILMSVLTMIQEERTKALKQLLA